MLDINPGIYGKYFTGVYSVEGVAINISISFYMEKAFGIRVNDENVNKGDALFSGNFELVDDKLYYTLKPYWQELTGFREPLVFEKVENYEVPSSPIS